MTHASVLTSWLKHSLSSRRRQHNSLTHDTMSNLSDKELTRIMDGFSRTHFKHRLCSVLFHENTDSVVRLLNLKLHEESCTSSCCIKGFLTFETSSLPFGGVFPSDRLPLHQTENVCYIFNTDPSTKLGEHWVAYHQVDGHAEFSTASVTHQ